MLPLEEVASGLSDARELLDMALEEGDVAAQQEIASDIERMLEQIEKLEFQRMFSGRADNSNAFLDIQGRCRRHRSSGLGGDAAPYVSAVV